MYFVYYATITMRALINDSDGAQKVSGQIGTCANKLNTKWNFHGKYLNRCDDTTKYSHEDKYLRTINFRWLKEKFALDQKCHIKNLQASPGKNWHLQLPVQFSQILALGDMLSTLLPQFYFGN